MRRGGRNGAKYWADILPTTLFNRCCCHSFAQRQVVDQRAGSFDIEYRTMGNALGFSSTPFLLVLIVNMLFCGRGFRLTKGASTIRAALSSSSSSSSRHYASVENEPVLAPTTAVGIARSFITNIIDDDKAKSVNGGRVVTRFPPEPNGYLHLGHAKSINFNFGVAKAYAGVTNMRLDDTNPAKENMEYVQSILEDVNWLITGELNPASPPWDGKVRHASDYFSTLYDCAEFLIINGHAYIEELSAADMKEYRGTLTSAGKNSPFRDRSIDENLQIFRSSCKTCPSLGCAPPSFACAVRVPCWLLVCALFEPCVRLA
jgi:hypothetical protein